MILLLWFLDINDILSCHYYEISGEEVKYCAYISVVFFPVVMLAPLSLLALFLRDEVFRAWVRFAKWWVPLSMFLILITPDRSWDWMFPLQPGVTALATSGIFLVVSLLIMATAAMRFRGRK